MSSIDPKSELEQLKARLIESEKRAERAEAKLMLLESRYKGLFDHLADEVHLWEIVRNPDNSIRTWRLVDVNPSALEAWGREKSDVIGKTTEEIFGPKATEQFMPVVQKICATGEPHEWVDYFPSSEQFLQMTSIPLGEYFISAGKDITEDRKARQRLEESQRLLEYTEDIAKQGSWKYDIVNSKWSFSKNWVRLFGIDKEYDTSDLSAAVDPSDLPRVSAAFNDAIHGKSNYQIEHRIVMRSGERKWVSVSAEVQRDESGNPVALIGITRDITDEKNAKKALEESEDFLNRTGALAKVGGWYLDGNFDRPIWTKATYDIHEVPYNYIPTIEEAVDFYHPEDRDAVAEAVNEAIEKGESFEFEARIITAKGNLKWIYSKGESEVLNGKTVRISGVFQDITEQKRKASRLEMLTKAIDYSQSGFDIVNHEGEFVYVNYAHSAMFGYDSPNELIGKSPRDLCVDPDFPSKLVKILREKGEYTGELRAKRKDGSEFVLLMLSRLEYDENGNEIYPTSSIDITKRKEIEQQLEQMNANLEKLVEERAEKAIQLSVELEKYWLAAEHSKSGVWRYNVLTNALEWDSIMYELFGIEPEEFSGAYEAWESSLHPDDIEENVQALQDTIATGKDLDILFRIIHRRTQEVRYIRGMGKVEKNSEGKTIAVFGTNWDVTDEVLLSKEKEKIIQELEVYKQASGNAEVGVWEFDVAAQSTKWDDTLFRIYEFEKSKYPDHFIHIDDFMKVVVPEDIDPLQRDLEFSLQTGKPLDVMFRIWVGEPRTLKYIRSKGQVQRNEKGEVVSMYGTNWDVTKEMKLADEREKALNQLRNAQSQLIQSEKMASLGILTAGVAHELNNPLNYIMGGYYAIQQELEDHAAIKVDDLKEYLSWVKEGAERATTIVKGLNLFSRNTEEKTEEFDLHQVIEDCLLMLHNKYKDRIHIRKKYVAGQLWIKGNSGKLHQAMLNILSNAIDAIEKKGEVVIETKSNSNEWIVVVSDNGRGIEDSKIEKVMDPFFTTKPPGKGTGLGLSITNSIIQEHNGRLDIASKQNKGTSVKMSFPKRNETRS